jgi:threonine dehydrogenase-like Zn-dependent dehydrogenase
MSAYGQPLELREYEVAAPEPGAILVRIRMAGICGSDLHMWRGDTAGSRPVPPEGRAMGHEGTGVVAALGAGVATDSLGRPLAEGDRVVFFATFPCWTCPLCLQGQPNLCVRYPYRAVGRPPYFVGTYADYVHLPPRHPVFRVPDDLSDEVVAPVNCAMCTVANGLRVAGARQGQTIVVQGAGGLGLTATALARDLGADRVIVLDRLPRRLDLARRFGADETIDIGELTTPESRVERVRELTHGLGADVVAELVGMPELLAEGVAMLRNGGTFLEIGQFYSRPVPFDVSTLVLTGKRIVGSLMYPPQILAQTLDFLERTRDRLPWKDMVSHRFPLAEVNSAFVDAEWMARSTEVVRGVLVP